MSTIIGATSLGQLKSIHAHLELGAILLAMRIKGESVEEMAGFMDAAEASFEPLPQPTGPCAPV